MTQIKSLKKECIWQKRNRLIEEINSDQVHSDRKTLESLEESTNNWPPKWSAGQAEVSHLTQR